MNKTKMTLIGLGGFAVLASAVVGVLAFLSWSDNADRQQELDDALSSARRLSQSKVALNASAVKAIEANAGKYAEWMAAAREQAASGDIFVERTSAPAFKAQMVADAKRMGSNPGAIEGKVVAADFGFGFGDYITGGKLPPADELPRLQREWADVVRVVDLLIKAEVSGISEITVQREKAAAEEAAPQPRRGLGGRSAKGAKKKPSAEAEALKPDVTTLSVTFLTRPNGLVEALNAFATDSRFIVAENLSFLTEADEISKRLGGERKEEKKIGGRRGGRRGGGRSAKAEEDKAEAELEALAAKGGVITDPQNLPDMKVSLTVRVYDFKTAKAAEAAPAEAAEAEAEEEE